MKKKNMKNSCLQKLTSNELKKVKGGVDPLGDRLGRPGEQAVGRPGDPLGDRL